jgi:ATP-binding cassette subfamily C (CFTR/MRP) protein 1
MAPAATANTTAEPLTPQQKLVNASFATVSTEKAERVRGESAEERAFCGTFLLYPWIGRLIDTATAAVKGTKDTPGRPLLPDDLLELPADEWADEVYENKFLPVWEEELRNPKKPEKGPSLWTALFAAFGKLTYVGCIFKFFMDFTTVMMPLVLQVQIRWLSKWIRNPNAYEDRMWEVYMLSVALMAMLVFQTICQNASMYYTSKSFNMMRTAVMYALFDKSTKLPGSHGLTGKITSMHGTDSTKFVEASFFVQNLWSSPMTIVGAVIALYFFIGPAAFIGFAAAIITVPIQGIAAAKMGQARFESSKISDRRLNRVNEFVQGIRIIKFMSWEDQFESQTGHTRQRELEKMRTVHIARSVFQAVLTFAPMFIMLVTFASAYGLGNDMNPEDVFPAFAMLNVLRAPLTVLPLSIAKLIELHVAIQRAEQFLQSKEHASSVRTLPDEDKSMAGPKQGSEKDDGEHLEKHHRHTAQTTGAHDHTAPQPLTDAERTDPDVQTMYRENLAVFIPNITVQYEEKKGMANESMATPAMKPAGKFGAAPASAAPAAGPPSMMAAPPPEPEMQRVDLMSFTNFKIPRHKLTVVIGPTAGGKSTLINAIVGEMLMSEESSKIYRRGTVAYVAQEAWIMNATLKDNILMGKRCYEEEYKYALLACQLKSDLEQLPGSDQTEIGERGINLSGGQKQRVAFARAVYSGREVVLMDDPLSAVDPHVCQALFHTCIETALAGRTRVLVTHQQQFLEFADNIVVVADRKVIFSGTYRELQQDSKAMEYASKAGKQEEEKKEDSEGSKSLEAVAAGVKGLVTKAADEVKEALKISNVKDHKKGQAEIRAIAENWSVPLPVGGAGPGGATALILAEKQDLSSLGFGVFGYYFANYGTGLAILTALGYASWRAVSVIADLIISWWCTRHTVFGHTLNQGQYAYWYAVAVAATGIFSAIRMIPLVAGVINASANIHDKIIHRLLRAPTSFYDTTPVGRILNRCGKDLEMLDVVIPDTGSIFGNLFLVVVGVWVVQTIGAWFMPIVYVVIVILFVYFFHSYLIANHGVKRLESVLRSPVLAIMNEALGGLPTIRAYAMVDPYRITHGERLHDMNKASYAWRNLQRWLGIRTDLLSALLIGAVGIISIALLQNLSREDQIAFFPLIILSITYSVVVAGAVGFLTVMLAELIAAFSSVERVREYAEDLEMEREVVYTSDAGASSQTEVLNKSTALPVVSHPPSEFWGTEGSVTFDHVYLRYREGLDLVLKDVSFHVKAGEKVGIVGRTGSGKSTVMLALFRMIECAKYERKHDDDAVLTPEQAAETSRILIDGCDIASLKLRDLRTKITIIPQDPLLFQGSIRSNLDPFNEHKDEELWEVLEKAHVKDRVAGEDDGLDCPVADRGANFSAGERQLICLARALLKNCKILLLDEATASIDPQHDRMLQETIRNEFRDRTVLTIAHRLGTIIDSDKVLVLDGGEVREYGLPHDLLQKKKEDPNAIFRDMVSQLGKEESGRLTEIARQKASEPHRA